MSNTDLLTVEESKVAAFRGWRLERLFELEMKKWVVAITPRDAVPDIVEAARGHDAVSLKALRLVVAAHQKGKK